MQDRGSWGDPGNPGTPPLLGIVLPVPLFPSLELRGAPMIVEMAAARAAVKFGSEAMAALTVSTMEVWRWPICSAGVPGSLGGKYIG